MLMPTLPFQIEDAQNEIIIEVPGKPISQGSLTTFRSKSTGRMISPNPKNLTDWRGKIAFFAMQEMRESELYMAEKGTPVVVSATFVFERPKNHYRTGKYSDVLKPSAPDAYYHTQAPDLDKLIRAVLDALSGVAYHDDSQVFCIARTFKMWSKYPPRAFIRVGW